MEAELTLRKKCHCNVNMMQHKLFYLLMLISGYNFLGPVPQSINLDDSNDFEVMDTIPDEEMKDVYDEEEMVKLNDKLEEKSKNLGAYYR